MTREATAYSQRLFTLREVMERFHQHAEERPLLREQYDSVMNI